MTIEVEDLTLKFGDAVAISELSLTVQEGEAVVLLGQSGCGKTSTMRSIAGLERPVGGRIRIGDTTVFDAARHTNVPPHKRNVGMVFQSYAIWPHMTVFENVAFPLRMQRTGKTEVSTRVADTLELVGLGHLADRGASMLSGGQMQRVALARSLVMSPSVLLLDEPLSNLDARLRQRLRGELRELQTRLGVTSIYVTHDQDEALALADRIALMQSGRIVQIGTPAEIYGSPKSASIADFLGVSNIIPIDAVDASTVTVRGTNIRLGVAGYVRAPELRACIRAEDVEISDGPALPGSIDATVVSVEFEGPTVRYRARVGDELTVEVLAPRRSTRLYSAGEEVALTVAPADVQVLDLEVAA